MAEQEHAYRRRRRPLRWVLTVLLLVTVVVAGLVLWNRRQATVVAEGCTLTPATGQPVTMDLEQGSNAATIAAVTIARGLPERALTIALATAMQESKLRNLEGGDRDSVGLFQQRPSQGWGTAAQIADPVYTTNKFLDALVKVNGYAQLPLTEAAQDVQKSGYPGAYAKHETQASELSSALTGRAPATFSCVVHQFATVDVAAAASASPASTGTGTTATAQQVGDRVRREFGRSVTSAVTTAGSTDAKAATSGPSLKFTPDPSASTDAGPEAQRQSGWAVAQWAVAHAQELGIGTVSYDGKTWRVDHSSDGWKALPSATWTDHVLVSLGMPGTAKH